MKTITFTFTNEVNDYGKRTEYKVKKVADLTIDDRMEFSSMVGFLEDVKKIWKMCVKPYGNASEFRLLEVTVAVYERTESDGLRSISFDRWFTRNADDICTDKDEPTVYLVPDEKYTEAHRDMCIGKNVYGDIAFTLG